MSLQGYTGVVKVNGSETGYIDHFDGTYYWVKLFNSVELFPPSQVKKLTK